MSNVNKNECVINGVQYKCRTCFDPGRTFFPLIDEAVNRKTWVDLLKNIAQFQTNDDEKLPKTLCCKCSDKLKKSYDFLLQIQDVNEKYSELLAKNEVSNHIDNAADCLEESAIALPLENFVAEVKLEEEMVMPYEMEMETNNMQEDNEDSFDNEDRDDPFTETFGEEKTTEQAEDDKSVIETTGENTTKRKLRKPNGARVQLPNTPRERSGEKDKTKDICEAESGNQETNECDPKGPILCGKCPQTFFTMYLYQKHQQEKHDSEELAEEKDQCPLCSKKFRNRSYINEHIKNVHDKLKTFKCSFCPKYSATASSRKIHELTHSDDFPYKCDFCEKRFRVPIKLRYHLEIHTTKPELLCPICKRGQKSQEELEAHVKNHDDNRFQCPSCGHLFRRKTTLTDHYNAVHLKLKPYKCAFCQQGFGDPKSRRSHQKIHHKGKQAAV